MKRINLLAAQKAIREYSPVNWLRRMAYSRQVDHALRYVCPKDQTFKVAIETLFWLVVAGFFAASAIIFVVMFVRWWLCM